MISHLSALGDERKIIQDVQILKKKRVNKKVDNFTSYFQGAITREFINLFIHIFGGNSPGYMLSENHSR